VVDRINGYEMDAENGSDDPIVTIFLLRRIEGLINE